MLYKGRATLYSHEIQLQMPGEHDLRSLQDLLSPWPTSTVPDRSLDEPLGYNDILMNDKCVLGHVVMRWQALVPNLGHM